MVREKTVYLEGMNALRTQEKIYSEYELLELKRKELIEKRDQLRQQVEEAKARAREAAEQERLTRMQKQERERSNEKQAQLRAARAQKLQLQNLKEQEARELEQI